MKIKATDDIKNAAGAQTIPPQALAPHKTAGEHGEQVNGSDKAGGDPCRHSADGSLSDSSARGANNTAACKRKVNFREPANQEIAYESGTLQGLFDQTHAEIEQKIADFSNILDCCQKKQCGERTVFARITRLGAQSIKHLAGISEYLDVPLFLYIETREMIHSSMVLAASRNPRLYSQVIEDLSRFEQSLKKKEKELKKAAKRLKPGFFIRRLSVAVLLTMVVTSIFWQLISPITDPLVIAYSNSRYEQRSAELDERERRLDETKKQIAELKDQAAEIREQLEDARSYLEEAREAAIYGLGYEGSGMAPV